ncbi:capsule assembly Wzi family protein [Jiulongibacter sediminis]|uniref:capsule assembly Wzi family protein n=1 Tax=Jiulongibacter sediminis TaxID=1605367 RepID=UPI0026F0C99A|nr:capsule assembly Wzi family protein [Jiulongibacter sediminis]
MRGLQCLLLLILSLVKGVGAYGQPDSSKVRNKFHYSFEIGSFFSLNNKIPFWQKANQFGAVPQSGNSLYFRQMIESKTDTSAGFFHADYCLDLATVVGEKPMIIIPEAFLKLNFGPFVISGGRFKEVLGLVDSTLSSGSITWSGNSLGIPQVRIAIPEYTKLFVPWLGFKGHYSHGWFGDQVSVKDYYLHQKALYGRIGSDKSRLRVYGGLLHHVQWGGEPKYGPSGPGDDRFTDGAFAEDWFTYGQVVFPFRALREDTTGYGDFELMNRFGNHIGQIDIGGDINLGSMNLLVYKQNIFETGQTFSSLTNLDDGLYGVALKSRREGAVFKRLVLEYLRTTNQGSYRSGLPRLLGLPDRYFGTETYYFNHMQYIDGWAYESETIGTPFLVPQEEIRPEKQSYPDAVFYNNNRIIAAYAGLNVRLNSIDLTSRVSYSRNYGALFTPIPPVDQMSMAVQAAIPLKNKNAFLKVNIGIDQGDLINDNYGAQIAYQRFW